MRSIAMEDVDIRLAGLARPAAEHKVDSDSFHSRPCLRHLSQAVGKSLVSYLIRVKALKPVWVFSFLFQPQPTG